MFLLKTKEHAMSFRMTDITLSQLVKCTGLKPRTLQFWTLNGVIHCDPETKHGGPGVPRRYGEDEAAIALVLGQIIKMPLQIGALREISQGLREVINTGPAEGFSDPYQIRYGDGDDYFDKAMRLKFDEEKEKEGDVFFYKHQQLQNWALFEFSRRGPQKVMMEEGFHKGKYVQPHEILLELVVDDIGRWQLDIVESWPDRDTQLDYAKAGGSYYEHGNTWLNPAEWSFMLTINLTRAFAKFREGSHRNGTVNNSAAGSEAT